MTLIYRLFGIPITKDDYIDALKLRNISEVRISIDGYGHGGPELTYSRFKLIAEAAGMRPFCVYRSYKCRFQDDPNLFYELSDACSMEAADFGKALRQHDIASTIDNTPVEKFLEAKGCTN